jgi:ribosomal protein S18 acetylase RimI-like enzyme
MQVRPYEPADRAALWELKARFERELGALGGEDKSGTYDRKLTAEYRERYGEWVDRCTERDPGCIVVAEADGGSDGRDDGEGSSAASDDLSDADDSDDGGSPSLVGYAFVLPEDLSLVWDAAVLNELYVRETARGGEVADALTERALDHARGQDLPLRRIVLDVDGDNDRARAFYRRHGFSNWGEMVARDL